MYDWTAMYVMHNALRRELEHLAKVATHDDDEAHRILAEAPGWDLFKTALHIHHTAEDEALWPPMRKASPTTRTPWPNGRDGSRTRRHRPGHRSNRRR